MGPTEGPITLGNEISRFMMGKSTVNGPYSIALLAYQRVTRMNQPPTYLRGFFLVQSLVPFFQPKASSEK